VEDLRDNYEQLRAYALSPAKKPERPMGLDLWFKKGFLSWLIAMAADILPARAVFPPPAHIIQAEFRTGLAMPLTNILIEWGEKHGGH
jgi:hypothetical protein